MATIHKITNPLAIGHIAPLIQKFYGRVKDSSGLYEGITYESLYAFLARLIQFGNNQAEFWIAMDGNTPVGFAAWHVMDLPHIGKVFCPCLYSGMKNHKAIKELYDEFINFGRRNRALIYQYHAVNERVGEYFKNVADKLGIKFEDTGAREYIGREK